MTRTRVLFVTFACFAELSHWFWVIFVAYKRISSGTQHSFSTVVGYSTSPRLRTPHNGRRMLGRRVLGRGCWVELRQSRRLSWRKIKGSASELARSGGIWFDNTMQGKLNRRISLWLTWIFQFWAHSNKTNRCEAAGGAVNTNKLINRYTDRFLERYFVA